MDSIEIHACKNTIKSLRTRIKTLLKLKKQKEAFTKKFLNRCSKYGIKVVAIQATTPLVESSVDFVVGPEGSVFAEGGYDSWPAIWQVCEDLNISGSCGNGGQHFLNRLGEKMLVPGVYKKVKGKWNEVQKV